MSLEKVAELLSEQDSESHYGLNFAISAACALHSISTPWQSWLVVHRSVSVLSEDCHVGHIFRRRLFLHKLEFKNKINGGEYSEANYSTEKLTQGAVVDLWQTD